ncbi:restriction endonuclease subunit S [Vibrio cholerae]|uniref:restriction endonuclease subunit S n=1 Tax=Vibrio cholerae TaxID=666 RepID=UPI0011582ADF|nr:restriction endonuclease subunit S [Vibrio cholerae]TQP69330.1 restriction endonuclease subunit S [Vibrio cholerae]
MSAEKLITDHIDIWTSAVQARLASGRGSGKKRELYGIKKLRELILELAVRGKLVPQDPTDEPASVLLERNFMEQARLVQTDKLKTKANRSFSVEDDYLTVPASWDRIRLGNLAKFIDYRGKTPKKIDSGVRLITAKNVKFGHISLLPEEFISEEEYVSWMTRGFPRVGDILFTPEAPLGNVAQVDLKEKFALAQRAICFQLHIPEISDFLKLFLMAPSFQNLLLEKATGTTAKGIKASVLKELLVYLPSLCEQHRIVAKVDELMALCDQLELQTEASLDAHQVLVETLLTTLTNSQDATKLMANWARISEHFDTLFTTGESIDQLKQTILQLAVMGKLVPQDPNDEPAAKLLERIAEEKALLVKEKKIKKEKPQPFISEDGRLFELPNGWVWSNIGETFLVTGGLQKTPKRTPVLNHYPYLAVANVQRGRLELDDLKRFEVTSEELERYRLMPGDLMVVEGNGSENEIGRCAIWSGEVQDCLHQNHLIKCRPLSLDLSSWVLQTLNSPFGIAVMKSLAVTSSGLYNLSVGKIRSIAFPLPPLKEQHRIVAKVDGLMALCDQLKSRLQTSQQTQLALAEALVEQAL